MKRVMVMFMAVFLCSLSVWCQPSAVPNGLSIEPFQELYEDGEFVVGARMNSNGWFEATFFHVGQEAKFD